MKTKSLLAALLAAAILASAHAQSPVEQAAAATKQGDLAAAEALLAPLTTGDKPDAAALNQLSIVRAAQKKNKEAVELAEKATKADPTQAAYFAQLGLALSTRMGEVGFMQQAAMSGKLKKAFEKTLELEPTNISGLIGLARYYANAPEIAGGSLTKAAEFAERLKQVQPFLGELELGRIAERGEKFPEALAHYEAAVTLRPDHAGAVTACGRVLAAQGKKDEARARFEAALKLNPNSESAKKGLAELDAPKS